VTAKIQKIEKMKTANNAQGYNIIEEFNLDENLKLNLVISLHNF